MAESSLFWLTNGTGDGIATSAYQFTDWINRSLVGDPTKGGVIAGYLGALGVSAATGSVSPLTVATGAATVGGVPYSNSTPLTVNVPTPAVGTTGYRLVLRANWTSQTVRVTLVGSPDGTGTTPALVQNIGTMFDVNLATFSITTSGSIINLVGNYGVYSYGGPSNRYASRLGNDPTNWSVGGTNIYPMSGVILTQVGTVQPGTYGAVNTAFFATSFSGPPLVFLSGTTTNGLPNTGVVPVLSGPPLVDRFNYWQPSVTGYNANVHFMAIGPA